MSIKSITTLISHLQAQKSGAVMSDKTIDEIISILSKEIQNPSKLRRFLLYLINKIK